MKAHMMMASGTLAALTLGMTLNVAAQAVSPAASAATFNPAKLRSTPPLAAPVRGNVYEVQPHLQAVEASAASGPVVEHLGNKAVVRSAALRAKPGSGVVPGTVVKNLLTGNLAYYSGHVVVLLKDRQQLQALQQKFGLGLVHSTGNDDLVILQAAPGVDLKALKTNLAATGWVREVKLDLVDKRYQPN